jgi:hypothetical protein
MTFSYKEDIEQAKRRVEAWWNGEILDRGVIQAPAPRHPSRMADEIKDTSSWSQEEFRDYFLNPDLVIPRLEKKLKGSYFGGESFPVMFPVSIGMVAITANYLGCPIKYVSTETTWHDPIIDDWERAPVIEYRPNDELWLASRSLLESAVRASDGYSVGCPDLNGPTELLGLLRDNERLAMDFYDHPGMIKPALGRINQAWHRYWQECAAITGPSGGNFHWMGFWSDKPSIDLQSDFSCMISCAQFDEYFLPFIEEQTRMVERTMYHLDGPGAIRHADSLLSLPKLSGIQWIQGAGGGSVLKYLPLLRKIQDAGKLLSLFCAKSEIDRLYEELEPEGLFPIVTDCASPEEAEEVVRRVSRLCQRKGSVHA